MNNLFVFSLFLLTATSLSAHAEDLAVGVQESAEPEADAAASAIDPMLPVRSDDPKQNLDPGPEDSPVAAKNPELLKKLKAHEGTYNIVSKDANTACHNMLDSLDQDVRLNVSVEQKDDEFGAKAGNVKVELQQKWKHSGKWGRVFDRADFSNINERKTSKRMGLLKITHVASYNEKKNTLTHVLAMSEFLQGSSSAQQQIEFSKDGSEFIYTYSYQSTSREKEIACKAVFKKKS